MNFANQSQFPPWAFWLYISQNKTGMNATSSPQKMKMWDQEEFLRCWVGQRKHKSDFAKQSQFFLKLNKPKPIYPP